MFLKLKRPSTAGARNQVFLSKSLLAKIPIVKKTLFDKVLTNNLLKNQSGRSLSYGKITAWHRGGRVKRNYTVCEEIEEDVSVVIANEYNPFSTNFRDIRFSFKLKKCFYSPSTEKLYPGSIVSSLTSNVEFSVGSRLPLKLVPLGSLIHSISNDIKGGAKYVRSAGSSAVLLRMSNGSCEVKLPSGKILQLSNLCFATLGVSGNPFSFKKRLSKAGQNRFLGKRPHVRGIAMNPVDHPHGGRTNGGKPSVTPWGLPTKSGFRLKKK